eukprot:356505_1
MDDRQQNEIVINGSIDLHLKYALGCYIKFKIYYVIDSQKNKWKRLQYNIQLKLMIKIRMQTGKRNFPTTIYAPEQLKYQFGKLVALYVVKTVGIAPECSRQHIMETQTIYNRHCNDNMELDIDGIKKLWILRIRVGKYQNKWDEYNRNKMKYIWGNKLTVKEQKRYVIIKGIKCLE